MVMPQLRGTQLDQGVSAQAQGPSAPPPGTRRETALREKVKGKLKEMYTLATGQDQPVTVTRPCLSEHSELGDAVMGAKSVASRALKEMKAALGVGLCCFG